MALQIDIYEGTKNIVLEIETIRPARKFKIDLSRKEKRDVIDAWDDLDLKEDDDFANWCAPIDSWINRLFGPGIAEFLFADALIKTNVRARLNFVAGILNEACDKLDADEGSALSVAAKRIRDRLAPVE